MVDISLQNILYARENVHQVGSILFDFFLIITQLAMFDLLLRFDHHRRPSSGTEEGRLKKAADGGRNVELSRTLLVV